MYPSFVGTVIVIFTLTSVAVLCVSSASQSSLSSLTGKEESLHLVKRGIDPVGSWLLKRRLGPASDVYGSQSHSNNWPIGGAARRFSQQDDEEMEQSEEEEREVKRRIDPVGSYLLRKRVIDPVGSYLIKKKGAGYASLQSVANE